ncbi:MAG: tRNA (adenosine(37)-N6)-dimethylallyltransferase MiaA, partial [Tannerella sp.]|nr:tRNA (adenosine(37)-N6)-dimethylallyltransferase MiaA [Tannerella sp.]
TLEEAIEKIKKNTRVYARKQMTWFKRDPHIKWFHPDDQDAIILHIDSLCHTVK